MSTKSYTYIYEQLNFIILHRFRQTHQGVERSMFHFTTELMVPLVAGLALFLFGMKIVEWALYQWTGPALQQLLRRITHTPLRGLLVGTGTTALLQSSSAVTVITIGFVN